MKQTGSDEEYLEAFRDNQTFNLRAHIIKIMVETTKIINPSWHLTFMANWHHI